MKRTIQNVKRFGAVALSLVMAIVLLPISTSKVLAERLTEGDWEYCIGWNYLLGDGVTTIYSYNGSQSEIIIPSTLGGYPVAEIDSNVFWYNGKNFITSVVIPNGVIRIDDAFSGCGLLTRVVIPDSVISIDALAFSDIEFTGEDDDAPEFSNLPNLTIFGNQDSYAHRYAVKYNFAFKLLDGSAPAPLSPLSPIVVGHTNGIVTWEDMRQAGLNSKWDLENESVPFSVNLTLGVTSIGEGVFNDCWQMTSITIPNSVTSISERAFHYLRMDDNNDAQFIPLPNLTINCYKNSYAHTYAIENGISFKLLDEGQASPTPTQLSRPNGLKLTAKRATWKNVKNNNGYILKIYQSGKKKPIKTVQIRKGKTRYAIPKKLFKKGKRYYFTLMTKAKGQYRNSKVSKSAVRWHR